MIADFLISYLMQTTATVGILMLYGYLIFRCNTRFYLNCGAKARRICRVTGILGTPLHELSHAALAILFGHKVKKIKFFQSDDSDDTLGYVVHSYNRKSLYQQIGNFFIGIAPTFVISLVLYLLAKLLIPDFTLSVARSPDASEIIANPFAFTAFLLNVVLSFFNASALGAKWWLYLVLGILLSLHMNLSGADIRNSLKGLFLLLALLLAVDFSCYAAAGIGPVLRLTDTLLALSSKLVAILTISLLLAVASVAVSAIARKLFSLKTC